jgi:hypothetical protein
MTIHGDIINNTKGVTIAAGTATPSEGFFCGFRVGQLFIFVDFLIFIHFHYINQRRAGKKVKQKKVKRQTTIYETLHRKLNIEQHEPH